MTLDPRGVQTFKGKKSQRKQKNLWRWEKVVCNVINTMVVAHNNELKFQGYLEIAQFRGKVNMSNIF
jgi:hypothetical protein